MILNLNNQPDIVRLDNYVDFLKKHKKKVEIKEVRKRRSVSQNNYLHLLVRWFSMETGYDAATVKDEFFKKTVNPEYFITKVSGNLGDYQRLRSTSELDTKQMTECIDRFRDWSSMTAGIYLPTPHEEDFLNEIQNQIKRYENAKYY